MSHFAEIDENNLVIRVLVGNNDDPAGDEGYSWFVNNLGGRWIQTSYSEKFRKNFAGIGFYYDEIKDAFIPPKPEINCNHPEFALDEVSCKWKCSNIEHLEENNESISE